MLWENINNYFSKLKNIFDISDMIKEAILLSMLILFIDRLDLVSRIVIWNLSIFILGLLLLLVKFFRKTNLQKINLNNINELDKYVFMSFFVILFVFIGERLQQDNHLYKFILLSISFVAAIILVIIRLLNNKSQDNSQLNVIDLIELYDHEIDLKEYNELLLIEESDVEYDLLHRKQIIDQLYYTIVNSYPSKSFTIGLNGKWGSGKTTIVNNVIEELKKNNEINNYVIVQLDPWKYDNEKAMLEDFLNQILDKVNFHTFTSNNRILTQEVVNSIFGSDFKFISKLFINELQTLHSNLHIEDVVNDYLLNNHKKMLIIIDNLDRIDADIALFLIKCLDSVLKFKNTINILLYDESIINEILKKKFHFNEKYMEKLVQLKIDVPLVNKNTIDSIRKQSIKHLLYDGKQVLDFVNGKIYEFDSLRELKRFLNLIISMTICTRNQLNKSDKAILSYIQLKCPSLYYEIWNNKEFFILYDRGEKLKKVTDDEIRKYYNEICSKEEYKPFVVYLEKLFPQIKKRNKKEINLFSYLFEGTDHINTILNNQISNARYFDLYFTNMENDFIRIRKDVSDSINQINSCDDYSTLSNKFRNYNSRELFIYLEIFDMCLIDINDDRIVDLIKFLFDELFYCKWELVSSRLNARQMISDIMVKLMEKITNIQYVQLSKLFFKKSQRLYTLLLIKNSIDGNKKKGATYDFDFDKSYEHMCSKIFDENINMYELSNYNYRNIWALYQYDKIKTQEYLKKIINMDNVYLLLNDLIIVSKDFFDYRYYIDKKDIDKLVPTINIDELINSKTELDDKEKFIKKVYEESLVYTLFFDRGINSEEYIEL